MTRVLTLAVMALVVAPFTLAHHSQSEFDFKLNVDVEGTVTKLDWRSPHARLYVDVVNKDGKVESWNFELPSPTTLMRRGWTRESLKVGDHVRVDGARAQLPDYCLCAFDQGCERQGHVYRRYADL